MYQWEQFPEMVNSRPAACAWGYGRVDVFWNAGGQLGHRWSDSSGWHTETLTPSVRLASDPFVCSRGNGQIDVFWTEPGGSLHQKWVTGGGWAGEQTLPFQVQGVPAAVASTSGSTQRVDLFWRDASGMLGHAWWVTGWAAWQQETLHLTDPMASDPAATTWGPNRFDVFWRSGTGSLVHKWFDGASFDHIEDRGGTFVDAPVASTWGLGEIDILVHDAGNQLQQIWYDQHASGWSAWAGDPGQTAHGPALAAWGDGRLDAFVAGLDGHLWHGWYGGLPVGTQPALLKSYWGFLRDYAGNDKVARILQSFACGTLNGDCSGAMVSPHLFMTASHCGGPGFTGGVSFYAINPQGPASDDGQQLTPAYEATTLPWQDSGIAGHGRHGDTVLWWLDDGPDGVPPGLRYGYQELSGDPVPVGTPAYSFFNNTALHMQNTLLYTDGSATAKHDDASDWRGAVTEYSMWSSPGCSGSTNLAPTMGQAVVGVTQGGSFGAGRSVVDAQAFINRHDADWTGIPDAIEYDWLITRPTQPLYLELFMSPLERARWVAVPGGSAVNVGESGMLPPGFPQMTGQANMNTDGYWQHFARFKSNAVYRVSVAALGGPTGTGMASSAYVKLHSDSSGDETLFSFTPESPTVAHRYVGVLRTGNHGDYRLILGASQGANVQIQSLCLVEETTPIGFGTHDERRSWQFNDYSLPVSWEPRGPGHAAMIVGPSTGWGVSNRFLGLAPSATYQLQFDCLLFHGNPPASAFIATEDLSGAGPSPQTFMIPSPGVQTVRLSITTGSGIPESLVFGANGDLTYSLANIGITRVS